MRSCFFGSDGAAAASKYVRSVGRTKTENVVRLLVGAASVVFAELHQWNARQQDTIIGTAEMSGNAAA